MAVFRSVWNSSAKNSVIYPRFFVLVSANQRFNGQIIKHHYHDNSTRKLPRKNNLTYLLTVGGALGLGYTLYKWKEQITGQLFNNSVFNIMTIYAKTSKPIDISQNRDRYNFIADVVAICAPSVVYIEIKDAKRMDFFTGKPATSNGSGFIVSADGLILTNAHVVNRPNTQVKVNVRLQDGTIYTGRVEDVDLQSDLATVRIDKNNLPVMKLGSSANIRPGEFVVAIGSPLTLSNTITSGVVSSAHRQSKELGLHHKHMEYIQTDAAITFGNSGGPLVNLNGEAIGINAMKVTVGISFAIPIDYAKEFLKKAETRRNNRDFAGIQNIGEHIRRRYIGVTIFTLTPDILCELQQKNDNIPSNIRHGVLVWKIMQGSPAYAGGLKTGDIITHVNGEPVIEASNIYEVLERPGALTVTVLRNGKVQQIRIEPEEV